MSAGGMKQWYVYISLRMESGGGDEQDCRLGYHGEEVDEHVGVLPDDEVCLHGRLLKPVEGHGVLQWQERDRQTRESTHTHHKG